MNIAPLTNLDLPAVMDIQDQAYPDVGHDSLEVFADKLRVFPEGCWSRFGFRDAPDPPPELLKKNREYSSGALGRPGTGARYL